MNINGAIIIHTLAQIGRMAPPGEQPNGGGTRANDQSGQSADHNGGQAQNANQQGGQGAGNQGAGQGGQQAGNPVAEWFVASTFRIGLAILGLVLLLFALGQAVGVPLLSMLGDALSTRVGRWLAVAVFALLLIVVALRGFGPWSSST